MDGATAIEIFRSGTHTAESGRAIAFSDADLAAIAAGYDPAAHEAPIVVGHPTTDAPAYGWISGLQVKGNSLQAMPAQLDQSFAELVKAGRFKKVSASFYAPDSPANPKPGQWYLKHVGFLGATPPAIKGLKQVAFNAAETGVETFAETWSLGLVARLFGSLRDMLIAQFGAEAADKALPRDTIDTIATAEPALPPPALTTSYAEAPRQGAPPPPQPSPANAGEGAQKEPSVPEPDPAAVAAAAAERLNSIEARERALREAEAAFAERERTARAAADQAFVSDLVAAGRLPKGLAATAAALLTRAPDAEAVSFSEGAAAETDRAALRRLLAALPPAVSFREVAAGGDLPSPDGTVAGTIRAAEALIKAEADKGHAISFREAVNRVSKEKAA